MQRLYLLGDRHDRPDFIQRVGGQLPRDPGQAPGHKSVHLNMDRYIGRIDNIFFPARTRPPPKERNAKYISLKLAGLNIYKIE